MWLLAACTGTSPSSSAPSPSPAPSPAPVPSPAPAPTPSSSTGETGATDTSPPPRPVEYVGDCAVDPTGSPPIAPRSVVHLVPYDFSPAHGAPVGGAVAVLADEAALAAWSATSSSRSTGGGRLRHRGRGGRAVDGPVDLREVVAIPRGASGTATACVGRGGGCGEDP